MTELGAQNQNLLSRGDLISRFYKHFLINKRNISIALESEVDYNQIRIMLNNLLVKDHYISENESISIHQREDPVLIFLFYLAIALDLPTLTGEQVQHVLFDEALLLPPIATYLRWKENDQIDPPPYYNMSLNDGHYTFRSGIKTKMSRNLVSDINQVIKKLAKSPTILPPPIGGFPKLVKAKISSRSPLKLFRDGMLRRRSTRIREKSKLSGTTKYTKNQLSYDSDCTSEGEAETEPLHIPINKKQSLREGKEITHKHTHFSAQTEQIHDGKDPKQNTLYPNLQNFEANQSSCSEQDPNGLIRNRSGSELNTTQTPFATNINSRISNFQIPTFGKTTFAELQNKIGKSNFQLEDRGNIKHTDGTVGDFKNNRLRVKYLMQNNFVKDFLKNCLNETLKDNLIKSIQLVDNVIYEFKAYNKEIGVTVGDYDFPPFLIAEDRQFTDFVFHLLSLDNREKLCSILMSLEDIINKYYVLILKGQKNIVEETPTEQSGNEWELWGNENQQQHIETGEGNRQEQINQHTGAEERQVPITGQQMGIIKNIVDNRLAELASDSDAQISYLHPVAKKEKKVTWINMFEGEEDEDEGQKRRTIKCKTKNSQVKTDKNNLVNLKKELREKINHNKKILKKMKEQESSQQPEDRTEEDNNCRLQLAQDLQEDTQRTQDMLTQIEGEKVAENEEEVEWIGLNLKGKENVNTTTALPAMSTGGQNNRAHPPSTNGKQTVVNTTTALPATPTGGQNNQAHPTSTTGKQTVVSTNLIKPKSDMTTQLSELNIVDKITKRLENKIVKFDGDRKKFLKFFSGLINKLDNKNYSDMIKIEVTKHFITGVASDNIETHTFTKDTWEEMKEYLVSRYILDKKLTQITLQKNLDNISLKDGESMYNLYSRIQEAVSLLNFLVPNQYKNKDDIIMQKLLSSIPSQYYYRLANPENLSLAQLLAELEKIQALTEALETLQEQTSSRFQDPAIRIMSSNSTTEAVLSPDLRDTRQENPPLGNRDNESSKTTFYQATNQQQNRTNEGNNTRKEFGTNPSWQENPNRYQSNFNRNFTMRNPTNNNDFQRTAQFSQSYRRPLDDRFNRTNSWNCNSCNTPNYNTRSFCFKCRSPGQRESAYGLAGNPRQSQNTCRLHRNADHRSEDCLTTCGFCRRRGSHLSENCLTKEKIKQEFVERKIRQFGVGAERLARSYISYRGIQPVSDETFSRLLRGQPVPPNERNFEDYQLRNRNRRE